jgi:hypothetical protein
VLEYLDNAKQFKSSEDSKVFNIILGLTNTEFGNAQSDSLDSMMSSRDAS